MQLVVVSVFTMIFALILTLMTNARRVETFAATSAYVHSSRSESHDYLLAYSFAAVQVVFVGSTSTNGKSN